MEAKKPFRTAVSELKTSSLESRKRKSSVSFPLSVPYGVFGRFSTRVRIRAFCSSASNAVSRNPFPR